MGIELKKNIKESLKVAETGGEYYDVLIDGKIEGEFSSRDGIDWFWYCPKLFIDEHITGPFEVVKHWVNDDYKDFSLFEAADKAIENFDKLLESKGVVV